MNDPNFPEWAQWIVLGLGGTVAAIVIALVIRVIIFIWGWVSWMNSGSH